MEGPWRPWNRDSVADVVGIVGSHHHHQLVGVVYPGNQEEVPDALITQT